jgi:hypothetical protein
MSWHYLQEQEVVSSEDISWDGKQFVQSKSKTTLGEYCLPDSETESFQDSPYGMTLRRSTENPGEGELMWYQGDSPVRTYLHKEIIINRVKGLMETEAAYGVRWHESFAKYDHSMSLWKTRQTSLFEDLTESLEIWPRWGMMQNGECWERVMSDMTIVEKEYGLSQQESGNQLSLQQTCQNANAVENLGVTNVINTTQTAHALGQHQTSMNTQNVECLRKLLPTPVASDRFSGTAAIRKDKGKQRLDQWKDYVKSVYGMTYPHPTHSEMRMGWPTEWSDLKPLAMDKFQQWQHLHGNY